jgi:hypothetical protein
MYVVLVLEDIQTLPLNMLFLGQVSLVFQPGWMLLLVFVYMIWSVFQAFPCIFTKQGI